MTCLQLLFIEKSLRSIYTLRSCAWTVNSRSIHCCFIIFTVHGAELNKSYVNDQLQPELSVRDISSWFHLNKPSETILEQMEADAASKASANPVAVVDELTRRIDNLKIDTQMANFKDLLLKVREIVDDSYSDNTELARTTQQLEKALDRIIAEEERKRLQSI